jgi:anti-sigma factor RsiW
MSPTAPHPVLDSSGHPPVETIAEYLEDLLPPTAAARLREHLADCAECRDTGAALQEIQSLLGQTDTPALPDDVGLRLDAALAAEALLAATPEPAPAPEAAPVPAPGSSGSASGSAGAPPRKPHSPSSGPVGGTQRPPAGPGRGRARGWRRAALGVAALAVVGLVGTAVVRINSEGGAGNGSSSGAKSSAVSAGTGVNGANGDLSSLGVLSDATLAQQVRGLLAGTAAMNPQAKPTSEAAARAAGAPACVLDAAARSGETPLTAAQGLYRGTPVTVLVYTDTAHPLTSVDAYLVDSSCRAGVLLHRTLPR